MIDEPQVYHRISAGGVLVGIVIGLGKLGVWKRMSPDEEAGSSLLLSRTFFAKETYFSSSEQLYPVKRSCIGTITGITNL